MKRITSFLLVFAVLLCIAAFASAESGAGLTLELTPQGRAVRDINGDKVNGAVADKAFERLYTLAETGKLSSDGVKCSEFEVFADENGEVSFGGQILTADDGTVYSSSNAEAVIFVKPNSFRSCGAGEAVLTVSDAEGNEICASTAKVTAMSSGVNLVINPCPQCGGNQADRLHALSCGHFSCQQAEVDHGTAGCGLPGHFRCDGKDHGICPNCHGSLCVGEHGAGVCRHIHTVKRSDLMYSASQQGMFQIVYCAECGIYYIDQLW